MLSLISILGERRVLYSGKPPTATHRISIEAEQYPPGFYLLELTSGTGRRVVRIIIE